MDWRRSGAWLSAALAAPALPILLWARPGLRAGLGERLGAVSGSPPGALWLHGASVGEARMVVRVAKALEAHGHPVFTTTQTPGGRSLLLAARSGRSVAYAPLDHPLCCKYLRLHGGSPGAGIRGRNHPVSDLHGHGGAFFCQPAFAK